MLLGLELKIRSIVLCATLLGWCSSEAQQISVYYYPWYSGTNWNSNNFLRGKTRMDIPPLIGTYDNVVNKVSVKQHIEWSTNFGIDNWITSWWGPDSYQSNAILKNIMPNLVGTKVTFCLFYETGGFYEGRWNFGASEVQMFYDHIKYMNDNFFSHPNYWKINGRPVVVVYLSRNMTGSYVEALTKVRKDFNVFLVGDDFHFGPAEPDRHKNWDAITIYNSHGLKTYDGYPAATGFIEGARQNFRKHKQAIAPYATKLISNVIPGYNDRAVRLASNNYPIPRRVHADSAEGSTFNQMLAMGIQEGDSSLGTAICSWNEWWEDSEIEPTVISPPTNKDGTTDFAYSKGYQYEGYGAKLLQMVLAQAGRNAEVAPQLALTDPTLVNAWTAGTAHTIKWNHSGIIYYVNLDYYQAGAWVRIATQIENTGSFAWTVPAGVSSPVNIRVSTVEGVTFSSSASSSVGGKPLEYTLAPSIQFKQDRVLFANLKGITQISIFDLYGKCVNSFPVSHEHFQWNTEDYQGRRLSPNLYLARFSGQNKIFHAKLLICETHSRRTYSLPPDYRHPRRMNPS
jgi:glycoprotein endo-alpha-1,2-mannosidase